MEREALKIALDYVLRTTHWTEGRDRHDTLKAIKEALAQPEQERNFCPRCGKRTADLTTIHTCTPPQDKATYWYYDKDGKLYSSNEVKLRISSTDNSLHFGAVPQHVKDLHGLLPLSIKREWVDLTEDEILKFQDIVPNTLSYDLIEFARAVLAKSKEKNT
jgi:hypothetical protein